MLIFQYSVQTPNETKIANPASFAKGVLVGYF